MTDFDATVIETDDAPVMATSERWARDFPATTPIEADLITVQEGISPGIASILVLSPTSIRINFERPALDNEPLRFTGSYDISPYLGVHSVTPEDVTDPTYVDLEVDEHTTGVVYTVTLIRLQAA